METTKNAANAIYNLVKHINPYEVSDIDKPEYIQNMLGMTLEENIKCLQDYICENYETVKDFLEDKYVVNLYNNILRRIK